MEADAETVEMMRKWTAASWAAVPLPKSFLSTITTTTSIHSAATASLRPPSCLHCYTAAFINTITTATTTITAAAITTATAGATATAVTLNSAAAAAAAAATSKGPQFP